VTLNRNPFEFQQEVRSMKKLAGLLLTGLITLAFAGCGADTSVTPATNPAPPPATAPPEVNTPSMSVPPPPGQ